jgi:RNA polymerase sigma factor (sigma-70 family)
VQTDKDYEIVLLCRAQAGESAAFDELYALLEPMIARFVRRLVGEGQAAEDIAQDTMTAFYFSLARINPPHMMRPFVFRIARNRAYDLLRYQGRHDHTPLETDDEDAVQVRISFDLAGEDAPLDDVTHWLLLQLEVREAMEFLPEVQRQTLILYAEEGLTYIEIAAVMHVSIGTVKSRLFHAKRGLRGLMRPATLRAIEDDL